MDLKEKIDNYEISDDAVAIVRSTPIVLLVGVSGAGKDTIKHRLLDTGAYHHIVSHTTRAPRSNNGVTEQDGVDYHFIDRTTAEAMIDRHEYIEVKTYSGNVYGTSVAEIRKAHDDGHVAITDLDVQGVAEYKEISPSVIAVFVLPPNYEEWQRRLHQRYGEGGVNEDDLRRRMETAIAELEEALAKPYYHYVVNENLDEAVSAVNSIARHNDEFTTIDTSFRVWAEKLLVDLRDGLTKR